ncbi:THAP domain-containing protein 7-like [Harpegnathos saltator]|uniref:THAP domain-containing protein 7-like n=1 Tax=Harpegnathos saltator TaxID=610380 RepID=UPI000DBEEBFD|nr:THAP domain-containing protein 7-like [Harpegnathos saltator]
MPTCCVPHCKNYYQKGFSLYSLPADLTRRALWITNIGRQEWNSSRKWFICKVHFSDNMWEKPHIDGKRKLKQHAVPTIFDNILTC